MTRNDTPSYPTMDFYVTGREKRMRLDNSSGIFEMDEETPYSKLEIFGKLGRQNRFLDIFENGNGASFDKLEFSSTNHSDVLARNDRKSEFYDKTNDSNGYRKNVLPQIVHSDTSHTSLKEKFVDLEKTSVFETML